MICDLEGYVTKIREPGFSIDLPGNWEKVGSTEPGALVYRDTAGSGTLTVVLLVVRPAFSIADRGRMHREYMQHRAQFERGQRPALEQSQPVAQQLDGLIEGSWSAFDVASERRQLHRVLMAGDVLADICYEDAATDEAAFADHAASMLATAVVGAPNPGDGPPTSG